MPATKFEYRFRFLIHAFIYLLGFGLIPVLDTYTPGILQALGVTTRSTWLVISALFAHQHLLTFSSATIAVLLVAVVFMALAAWFRIWGSAYVGMSVVQSPTLQATGPGGRAMLADGPYRRTRNPLYLGILLHTFALSILMTPVGAIFTLALIWIFEFRLVLAEEPFLTTQYGQPYRDYMAAVPRFLPAPTPQVPSAGDKLHWLQAVLGEVYFLGATLTLLIFGWSFNANPMRRGLLISLGIGLIVRAFLPKPKQD
ncbi:isoprenylcysteine carboxylmethyltransferase family protein [Granulicella sp. 5B5]|uniref:methyltransferase family protein n=1 Tax=Granulicella sp. 5B5 TaxID=1617967 RepID=UPI0015F5BF85|nr:isoprenylcysteine carboxylmethyltransferase family protein [Granulicella sp. 5B5]QMV18775.1 isoprenylcysteine carboxylmethyltransferase family protein [Granulicella sp. 5B5]